jgi:hypothetical protein
VRVGHGKRIDNHPAVFRCNWPLLRGYERDVGVRTTHMLVNRKSLFASHWPPYASVRNYTDSNVTILAAPHFIEVTRPSCCAWTHVNAASASQEFVSVLRWNARKDTPQVLAITPAFRRLVAGSVSASNKGLLKSKGPR